MTISWLVFVLGHLNAFPNEVGEEVTVTAYEFYGFHYPGSIELGGEPTV